MAQLRNDPFTLGIASGEPTADGMVLWTRLAPQPLQSDGGMPQRRVPVRWEIFADDALRQRVLAGEVLAHPELAHSVHVEVSGLASDRPYWFRFLCDGIASPAGRTRTAPAPGSTAEKLRFCFASCQKYEAGFYAAWSHVVADEPDLILFLGDYIYEGAPAPGGVRLHLNPEPMDLAGYRIRYATYKLDGQLQAAHAAAPWAVTWDDHEVANDYAGLFGQNNEPVEAFRRRRAAAYQAYYEHLPLRATTRTRLAEMRLYRSLQWGRLAQFQIVDDRQYRSSRPCQPPELSERHQHYQETTADCPERTDPARSYLGAGQEHWLMDQLGKTRATWNILAQQTLMMPYRRRDEAHPEQPLGQFSIDTWSGYPATRERILARWQEARVSNPLVVSGDIHSFVSGELYAERQPGKSIAPEFVGGAISSTSHDPYLKEDAARQPGFRFTEIGVRGYGRVDVTARECQVAFRGMRDSRVPNSEAYDLARFTVEAGSPAVHRLG